MEITLTPELEAIITQQIEAGRYPSAEAVLHEGLRLIREQETIYQEEHEEIQRKLDSATAQIERGEVTSYASGREAMNAIEAAAREKMAQGEKVPA